MIEIELLTQYKTLFIGYSGGLDSTVLLHYLANTTSLKNKIRAIHINHGLSANSLQWQTHCATFCNLLQIPYQALSIDFHKQANIEENARIARYAAFASLLTDDDCLLLGHHADDQAETLLLQLARGAGIDGMAAMPVTKSLSQGILIRPLLHHPRAALEQYATTHGLTWIVDESNQNVAFSRNYIRHYIMQSLKEKWPHIVENFSRTALHCQQANLNLDDLAKLDCKELEQLRDTLPLQIIAHLASHRIVNVLRYWLKKHGIQMPNTATLTRLVTEVIHAPMDANPSVAWGDVSIRRYRQNLYLLKKSNTDSAFHATPIPHASCTELATRSIDLAQLLELIINHAHTDCRQETGSASYEQMQFLHDIIHGNAARIDHNAKVIVKFRQGGESIVLHGQTKSLKKLMQEWAIPPWHRDKVPLIYIDDCLAMVCGYAISDKFQAIKPELK